MANYTRQYRLSELIALKDRDKMTYRQIAERYGMSMSTVIKAIQRGKKNIQREAELITELKEKQQLPAEDLPDLEVWAETIKLPFGRFSFEGHEYQKGILADGCRVKVLKKGSQLGLSETQIFTSLHGMMTGRYPHGVMYLFPNEKDVSDFSKARFNPLLMENPLLAKEVKDTDSVNLKRIKKAMLYLRGARATSSIQGQRKMSTQLISIAVDRIVFDERDLMDEDMIELALTRMGHSGIGEEVYLGTPSLPDYGVSKLYEESDQKTWQIKCSHCGQYTCLETEFPMCLVETAERVIRVCRKCRKEIFPRDGIWVAQNPNVKELSGYWISRLNSPYEDLRKVLQRYADPSTQRKQDLYNSVLALPYVPAENRLSQVEVLKQCGQEGVALNHAGPCAMGVDVGNELHVVIGYRKTDHHFEIVHLARLTEFEHLHDLIGRFNVKCCVIDVQPETRKAKEVAKAQPWGRVWLCDYVDSVKEGPTWDEPNRIVKANRTETCDATHDLIANSLVALPRKSEEVMLFSKQASNMAKILIEDKETGSRLYEYKKLGADHYRHALNYFWVAAKRVAVADGDTPRSRLLKLLADNEQDQYNPLTHGLPWKNTA